MLSVSVHKDIGEYTEKIVGKLSVRTLACTAGGLASSVAAAALCHFAIGVPVESASLPVMAASMPFWLAGFWRPKGMVAERFLPLLLEHALTDGKLAYCAGNGVAHLSDFDRQRPSRKARRAARRKGVERHVCTSRR